MKNLISVLVLFFSVNSLAQMTAQVPNWFLRDLERRASWVPREIHQLGLNEAIARRWSQLPNNVQWTLHNAKVPAWMIALIPNEASRNEEIYRQLMSINQLAGPASGSAIAARAELLLFFGGAAQLPTPGDSVSGKSLGAQGCTAAMSKYVMADLLLQFPNELRNLSAQLGESQSSAEMKTLFYRAAQTPNSRLSVREIPFEYLSNYDVAPGSLMIAQKPSGTHVFGWTRVPTLWNWNPNNKMAIGNTGLPQFGDRMILAQEFLTDNPNDPHQARHNMHGPINSRQVAYKNGRVDVSDPRTNVYAVKGSSFIVINFN